MDNIQQIVEQKLKHSEVCSTESLRKFRNPAISSKRPFEKFLIKFCCQHTAKALASPQWLYGLCCGLIAKTEIVQRVSLNSRGERAKR